MDKSYDINRRPLTEVVCKHGSSKLFFSAIVLSIISTALSLLYGIYSSVAALDTELPFVDLGPFIGDGYYITVIVTVLITVVNAILVFVQNGFLFSAYSFFSGKSKNGNGLKTFSKVFLIQIIFSLVEIPVLFISIFSNVDDSFSFPGALATIILAMSIILIPVLAGITVLLVFHYKGVKKSINHAMAAYENRNIGKVSTLVLVMAFISAVAVGFDIITALSSFGMVIFNAPTVTSVLATLVNVVTYGLMMASTIMYIVLIFRYKNDMELAKQEWFYIEHKKAYFRAQEFAAEQASDNTYDETQQ